MNYPQVLQFETTTACNAHCGFCPHAEMNRAGQMSDELVAKILDEVALWPVKPASICPFVTNEPFADRRVFDISSRIREVAPDCELTFFTNASLLNQARRDAILAIPGRTKFFCSLHHTNVADYKAELGLDFHRTVDNIKALTEECETEVTVLRVGDGTQDDGRFINWVRANIPKAQPMLAARWNWKGDIASHERNLFSDIKCPRATSLIVLHDGRVALCCMDQAGQYSIGDIRKSSLLEVYNSPAWHRYFDNKKSANSPCNQCNMR